MGDALQPFRPRSAALPAENPLEVVHSQLAQVRWRANGYTLQQALYPPLAAITLGLCALSVLAVWLSRPAFAYSVWFGFAAVVALSARSLLRGTRGWLQPGRTAVAIDHRAGLEDRLATLASLAPVVPRSPLWEHLVGENLRLLHAWRPEVIVPRRFPRSGFLVLSALGIALLLLAWRSAGSPPGEAAGGTGEGASADTSETESPGSSSLLVALPEALRRALAAEGAAAGSADGPSASGAVDGGKPAGGKPANAPDARPAADGTALRPPSERSAAGKQPPGAARGGEAKGAGEGEPLRGEAPKALARVEVGQPRTPQKSVGRGEKPPQSGGPASGAAGSGTGGSAESLFGDAAAAQVSPRGSFTLDLEAERSARAGKGQSESDEPSPVIGLAPDARLDDAIRRAQVPAEYEKIVRRLFERADQANDHQ